MKQSNQIVPLLARGGALIALALMAIVSITQPHPAHAEYGDIVINNYSTALDPDLENQMRPVVFPHWFHRIRFRCKVCHADLGFKFQAGGNNIDMEKIINGEYCGACHNGEVAWSIENCDLCHSAVKGTPTQVHMSTLQQMVAPVRNGEGK